MGSRIRRPRGSKRSAGHLDGLTAVAHTPPIVRMPVMVRFQANNRLRSPNHLRYPDGAIRLDHILRAGVPGLHGLAYRLSGVVLGRLRLTPWPITLGLRGPRE
jgi:hypothetical protein